MLALLLTSALVFQPQLTPVAVELGNPSGGLLSHDGKFLLSISGEGGRDLMTGERAAWGWFRALIRKGRPYQVVSITMNQAAHNPKVMNVFGGATVDPNVISSDQIRPEYSFCDVLDKDHVLVYLEPSVAKSKSKYIVLSEIRTNLRTGNSNSNWLLQLPGKLLARPVGGQFIDDKTVELWVIQPENQKWFLVRYIGSRNNPSSALLQASRIEVQHYRISTMGAGFVPNSLDPRTKTFVAREAGIYELVTTAGKVLKKIDTNDNNPRTNGEIIAMWNLTVPEKSVPQGKDAWVPIAKSANGRAWLLKEKSSGEHKLLHL